MKTKIIRTTTSGVCMDEIVMLIGRDVFSENNGINMSDYLYTNILFNLSECISCIPAEDNWKMYFLLVDGNATWVYNCTEANIEDCDAVYSIKSLNGRLSLAKFWKED